MQEASNTKGKEIAVNWKEWKEKKIMIDRIDGALLIVGNTYTLEVYYDQLGCIMEEIPIDLHRLGVVGTMKKNYDDGIYTKTYTIYF